ncbi:MAG: dihydrodipicolinate synthase family protein [Pseudomonadota bacterium]
MQTTDLKGFHPAIVTPFSATGEIMEDAFQAIVDHLIGIGAEAICVAGDNGESWALSAAERRRLVRLAVDRAGGRPVTCGCSAPTAAAALDYARAAAEGGAAALLSMPPTYVLKGTRAEIVGRYEKLASIGLPIIAYNSPRRQGHALSVADIAAIRDAAPVIGIKESSRDFFHHTHLLHAMAEDFAVMTGPCHYIVPSLPLGARGFIATGPEFLGPDAGRIVEVALAGPSAEARAIHHRLTVIYETLMSVGTWPSAFKAALGLIGLPAGVPRDPVMPATPADVERLRAVLGDLGIRAAA